MRHQWALPCCILTYTAGVQHVCPLESFPDDKWDLIIAVNLTAAFHLTKHIVPGMKERGGSLHVCVRVCACVCVCVHVRACVHVYLYFCRLGPYCEHSIWSWIGCVCQQVCIHCLKTWHSWPYKSESRLPQLYLHIQAIRQGEELVKQYIYEVTTVTVSLCVVRTAC